MKLKKECVRDLLLYFEKNLSYENEILANCITLKKYTKDDILYTSDKLLEAGLINAKKEKWILSNQPIIIVSSITTNGHRFLDSIRSPEIWRKTKSKLKSLGSVSIEIISQVAASVITGKLGV